MASQSARLELCYVGSYLGPKRQHRFLGGNAKLWASFEENQATETEFKRNSAVSCSPHLSERPLRMS